ncbi:ATP-dependent RNA helicase DDX31 [Biomphalaria glabrata]|nr:ATP-dependent RNA helicase DDX31 [Biomphalaria glabrata]
MAEFSNISLNLSTDVNVNDVRPRSRSNKNRANKKFNHKEQFVPAHTKVERREESSPKEDNRKRKLSDNAEISHGKKPKSDMVISSLFRKNPDIPEVLSSKVETVSENVFTGETFKELPLHPFLISNLEEKQGFKQMTEVQKKAIPVLLKKKDALIKSQTGSGKTLAYAVPIVQMLQSRKLKIKRDDGPYALIIVPTRELVLQSYDTFVKLLRTFIWIVPGCLMGGEKRKAEKSRLRKGVNILVATPGRLMDHIKFTSVLHLARIQWLVIDEADRLLELGYERDIALILNALKSQCPDPPQTVLLSATLTDGVERLSSITLDNPEHICVGELTDTLQQPTVSTESSQENFTLPSQLKQYFIVTPCKLRLVTLAALMLWKCKYSGCASKMIIFMSTQDSVHFHSKLLNQVLGPAHNIKKTLTQMALGQEESSEDGVELKDKAELTMYQLHGDMQQKDRTYTFNKFAKATSGVLLCTDVAARGLDLPHVDWIVQYTSPGATVDYIHRVGRTARAGTKGQSVLFLMPSEVTYIQELNKHKISLDQMDVSSVLEPLLLHVQDLPQPQDVTTKRQTPKTVEEAATFLQDRFEECVLNDKDMNILASKGFQSYIRAYATYSKEVKNIFKVSDLHLGHVAKSFALRVAPALVHNATATLALKHKKKTSNRPDNFRQVTLSEYSSGLQAANCNVKTKPSIKRKFKTKLKWK